MAIVLASLAARAAGQSELQKFQRQLEQIQRQTRLMAEPSVPPGQRALVNHGGYLTFNFLTIDDTDQNTHILRESNLTYFAQVNIDGVHQFFVRGRTTYRDFNRGDTFDSHGDDWVQPTLDRGHYRFSLKRQIEAYQGRTIDGDLTIQGGRQLIHWANGLTLSQQIDGGQVNAAIGSLSLHAIGGITRDSSTDIDSSRPGFSSDTKRGFYGGLLSFQAEPRHRPFIYGLIQEDYNDNDVLVTPAGDPATTADDLRTRFEYTSHYIGIGSSGSLGDRLAYGVEVVYQGGEGLSNSIEFFRAGDDLTVTQLRQTRQDIEAFAADLRFDYLLTDANRTRLSAEVIIASGDSDRQTTTSTLGGNQSNTDDKAFNAFGLINTGLAFNPNVSNLVMVRVGGSTIPWPNSSLLRRLQVGVNVFVFHKFDHDAPTDEQDVTEPVKDEAYLGTETDLFANWQVTSDVSLTLRYGMFFPGRGIATDHDERHLLFTGLTFAF